MTHGVSPQGRNLPDRNSRPIHIGSVLQRTNPGVAAGAAIGLSTTPDPRARPQPECECPLCHETVEQLVQTYRYGRFTLGCWKCSNKKHCGHCDEYVDAIEFVEISKGVFEMWCDDCVATRQTAPEGHRDALPIDPYCCSCHEPYTPKHAGQLRCAGCADYTVALWQFRAQWLMHERWHIRPEPAPRPPQVELVKEPEKLTPMVLWRAMWAQAWVDWQRANNPAVLIRRLDASINAGPQLVKSTEAPAWEQWSEAEFQQNIVVPKAA